jgi:AraC-like DNA-binding protein
MSHILFAGNVTRPILALPAHSHDAWLTVIYTFGRGSVIWDEQSIRFQKGTVICVPPLTPYAETSDYGFRSIFIAADKLPLDRFHYFQDDDRTVTRIGRCVVEFFNRDSAPTQTIAEQLFDALALHIGQRAGTRRDPYTEQLKELIHQNWSDPELNLSEAMERIPISATHLRRTFTANVKIPPVRYLLEYRIKNACRLLALEGYSVTEVSGMCGFSDPYYFSRAFHRLKGISPSRWRASRERK